MAYTLISFDLDGTLVDTADEIAEAANRCLDELGLPRWPVPAIVGFIGHGTRELMRQLLAAVESASPGATAGLDEDRVFAIFDLHYAQTTGTTARPYPGAEAMLVQLRDAGLRLACVTNKEQRHAERVLQAVGLSDHFDLLIGGDTLPEKKPHPSVIDHVRAVLGAVPAAQCAHLGDSRTDVLAARASGVSAWAVPWGYNAGRPIQEDGPDRIFNSLAELGQAVLGGIAARPAGTPR